MEFYLSLSVVAILAFIFTKFKNPNADVWYKVADFLQNASLFYIVWLGIYYLFLSDSWGLAGVMMALFILAICIGLFVFSIIAKFSISKGLDNKEQNKSNPNLLTKTFSRVYYFMLILVVGFGIFWLALELDFICKDGCRLY